MKDFINQIESKILQQLRSQSVGFLLGAGASYLDGRGYPLAADIWLRIKDNLEKVERDSIQAKLDAGADGLEQALDLLDEGNPDGMPLRYKVAKLIGDDFRTITPPLDIHRQFVKALARSRSYSLHIFCLNYDPLIERAAEEESVRVIDGFVGTEHAFYDPSVFQQCAGLPGRKREDRYATDFAAQLRFINYMGQSAGISVIVEAFGDVRLLLLFQTEQNL